MIELGLSVAALIGCLWAIRQCIRFRHQIEKENERVEWLKRALVNHELAPNAHEHCAEQDPWEVTRRPMKRELEVRRVV